MRGNQIMLGHGGVSKDGAEIESLVGDKVNLLEGARRVSPGSGWRGLDLRELWEHRELLYFLVWRDIKVRYKQTLIGVAWSIIQPLLTMLIFTAFFGTLAKLPSDNLPYPLFYYAALLPWAYFSGALQQVTNTIIEHQRVITKVYFPRVILPLAAVLSGLVDFAVAAPILVGMMLAYGMFPGLTMLLLPVFLLLAVVTAFAIGLWLSALNAIYRDVRYVVPFLIQCWMFASPVAYPSSLVPERWRLLYGLNPITGVIEGFRWAIQGQGQLPILLGVSVVTVLIVLFGGVLYFQRMEGTIVDVV